MEVRQQFTSEDGSLIKVTNITTHTLGVVLWDADSAPNARWMVRKRSFRQSGVPHTLIVLSDVAYAEVYFDDDPARSPRLRPSLSRCWKPPPVVSDRSGWAMGPNPFSL